MADEGALWFVDIIGRRIHRFDPASGLRRSWPVPEPIGFLAPAQDGDFLCGLKSGLHRFAAASGTFQPHLRGFEPPELDNRLNDGFVDGAGRLWFGSMHDAGVRATGALYRLDHGPSVLRLDAGYRVTNGPAASPDGRVLYHVDTVGQTVWAFDVSPAGELAGKRPFLRIERPGAFPDGLAVDSEGGVWVALFGGWGVDRYDPGGHLIDHVELPCANVTKPAFGGAELKTLYVTTARTGLSAEELAAQPLAGGLFRLDSNVAGLPQHHIRHGL